VAGETVIARWQGSRHFYAILSGSLEVRGESERLGTIGPGEFFGELAALDWGAGFGYARTATVQALTDVRLLALAPAALAELCRRAPAITEQLRDAARRHLARM
jgi:CRP-like cAMP-binding protein